MLAGAASRAVVSESYSNLQKINMSFKLQVEPDDVLKFQGPFTSPVLVKLKLTNSGDSRKAYKVKCTSNKMFRIRPVVGLLRKDESVEIHLTTSPMEETPTNKHHFALFHVDAPDDAEDARSVWEKSGGAQRSKRLRVQFCEKAPEEEEGEEKQEEAEEKSAE